MLQPWSGVLARLNTPHPSGLQLLLEQHLAVPTRDLPLPLTVHNGEYVTWVGIIETITRDGNTVYATGKLNTNILWLTNHETTNSQAPIAVGIDETDDTIGWCIRDAVIAESLWGDTTITVHEVPIA